MISHRPNSQLAFSLKQWCFWQAEPVTSQHKWPCGLILPSGTIDTELQFLPMMQRRRLSPLGKAACAVAWNCAQAHGNLPTVFFSAHGESRYYFEMLQDLANGEALSPSRFSLCVHNAIAGLFSFQTQNVLPYVSLAGGTEGILAAFIEASGLLLEANEVMLVCYDQALPIEYQNYLPTEVKTWALALVLGRVNEANEWQLNFNWTREPSEHNACNNQPFLDIPQAIITDQRSGCLQPTKAIWSWTLQHA